MTHIPLLLVLTVGCVAMAQTASDIPESSLEPKLRQERLALMRKLIEKVEVYVGEEQDQLVRIQNPLMRHDDASRNYKDGTMWAFGKSGRPKVMMILQPDSSTQGRWWHAATSLTDSRISARLQNRQVWDTKEPGIKFQRLTDVKPPVATKSLRLAQMRRMAGRFSAHQFWNPNNQRFQLRLLRQPLHRYEDTKADIVDGAVFGFMVNTHPELLLVLEAIADKDGEYWRYGFAKIGSAEFHGKLDDTEVYESGRAPGVLGRTSDAYRMFASYESMVD